MSEQDDMREHMAGFDHPFEVNDCGLWCPHCGAHIAAPWNVDENYTPPNTCKCCGFPDEISTP